MTDFLSITNNSPGGGGLITDSDPMTVRDALAALLDGAAVLVFGGIGYLSALVSVIGDLPLLTVIATLGGLAGTAAFIAGLLIVIGDIQDGLWRRLGDRNGAPDRWRRLSRMAQWLIVPCAAMILVFAVLMLTMLSGNSGLVFALLLAVGIVAGGKVQDAWWRFIDRLDGRERGYRSAGHRDMGRPLDGEEG